MSMSVTDRTQPEAGDEAKASAASQDRTADMPAAEARPLRLVALDAADLTVLSALAQDALTRPSEMRRLGDEQAFVLTIDRLAREERPVRTGPLGLRKRWQRRRSLLEFRRVAEVKRRGFADAGLSETPLVLLTLAFTPHGAKSGIQSGTESGTGSGEPGGTVDLTFAGGATVRLEVEVVEARLTDLGPAWMSEATPRHAG